MLVSWCLFQMLGEMEAIFRFLVEVFLSLALLSVVLCAMKIAFCLWSKLFGNTQAEDLEMSVCNSVYLSTRWDQKCSISRVKHFLRVVSKRLGDGLRRMVPLLAVWRRRPTGGGVLTEDLGDENSVYFRLGAVGHSSYADYPLDDVDHYTCCL